MLRGGRPIGPRLSPQRVASRTTASRGPGQGSLYGRMLVEAPHPLPPQSARAPNLNTKWGGKRSAICSPCLVRSGRTAQTGRSIRQARRSPRGMRLGGGHQAQRDSICFFGASSAGQAGPRPRKVNECFTALRTVHSNREGESPVGGGGLGGNESPERQRVHRYGYAGSRYRRVPQPGSPARRRHGRPAPGLRYAMATQ